MFYIGVMSGTSCDGVDVALVDFNNNINLLCSSFKAYPNKLKAELLSLIGNQPTSIKQVSRLDAQLGLLYAEAINDLLRSNNIESHEISAIGLHGQTVFHDPTSQFPNTIQLGSAAITAQQTNIVTIANFRQMDVAHDGQGAPLAPVLHQELFAIPDQVIAVLNLGGIANISILENNKVFGFDTGPANCLMDEWVLLNKGQSFDKNGEWAQQGKVNEKLLSLMLKDPFFIAPFPKSTGRELFNLDWLNNHLHGTQIDVVDVQRTLLQLTVESVAMAINQSTKEVNEIVVCGGGAHNEFLLNCLSEKLKVQVSSTFSHGIDPDFIEAILMAWLAKLNIMQVQMDLSPITGVKKPLVYGVKYVP